MTMPPADNDHLPDEGLSAIVDGEAPMPAHVTECEECTRRLGQLSEVANAVRSPVPPLSAEEIDQFVNVAMGGGRAVTSLVTRRRSVVARPYVFALAAAILVVVGIPSVMWMTRSTTTSGSAARLSAQTDKSANTSESASTLFASRAAGGASAGAGSGASASDAALAPPHLGEIDTPGALVDRLRAEPTSRPAVAASGTDSRQTATPQASAAPYATSACEANVRRSSSAQVGALEYVATLVWQGTDAEVLVFAPTGGLSARDAVVTARSDCRELDREQF